MISAEVYDAGTRAVHRGLVVPGMDQCGWTSLDFEYSVASPLDRVSVNEQVRAGATPRTVAPWPLPFREACHVDYTDRYRGLALTLHEWDQDAQRWAVCPGAAAAVFPGVGDNADREDTLAARALAVDEVQAQASVTPAEWLRLPFTNELDGTALAQPLELRWHGVRGSEMAFSLEDNDYFEPWDLTVPDRYSFVDDAGVAVERGEVYRICRDRARLALYLRPRRWRIFARTIAHYWFVSGFWEQPVDEVFLRVYWDRPPFAPVRQYVAATKALRDIWYEWFGGLWVSYDAGLQWAFDHSRTAAELRDEIADAQWWDMCSAMILMSVEPAVLVVDREPPQQWDVVMGIGRVDVVSGREDRVWAVQTANLDALYPRSAIGTFYGDFF